MECDSGDGSQALVGLACWSMAGTATVRGESAGIPVSGKQAFALGRDRVSA